MAFRAAAHRLVQSGQALLLLRSAAGLLLVCALLVYFGNPSARAQQALGGTQSVPEQVPLDADRIERALASMPAMKEVRDGLEEKHGDLPEGGGPMGALQGLITNRAAMAEINAVVADYGFDDAVDWYQSVYSVMIAGVFAKDAEMMGQLSEMEAALDEIRNSDMPQNQKDMLLQQMQAGMGMLLAMKPSEENLAAVRPYLDQIERVMEEE